jgi:peptidoglycan/xylan/chitin deacetylase (PgdA/CDA1 family)
VAGVLGVSVVLTRRTAQARTAPPIEHFSGSVVVQKLPSVLESPRLGTGISVDILRDDASAGFYDSPATLDSIIGVWRTALTAAGADVRVVAPQRIGTRRARVLVIPSSPCLTIASREAIEAAANDGRGLIFTGLTGNRDIGCRPIGYGLIVAAAGASRASVVDARSMLYVALPGGSPLTEGIPPGARLEINPGAQVALRGSSRDAFYSDYSLRPAPAGGQPMLDAAVARSTLGNARVVYWGFEPRDVAPRPWSEQVVRLLMRNSVRWVARVPTASLEAWPNGRIAAAAIAQDVEDQFANAALALDSLEAIHFPGTYFLTTRLARSYSRLTRAMAAQGEVGSHSENHWVLGGNPPEVQRRRLLETRDDLDDILGHSPRGLRPPEEQFDVPTLAAWAAAGGTYVFGANDDRSASPELLSVGGDTIVLIGRFGSDDFAAAGQHRGDAGATEAVFIDDFERVRALGGAYVLSYHSQVLARPEWIAAMSRTTRAIAADSAVWRTTTGDIAAWWRARAAVTADVDATRRDRVLVHVRNGGRSPIDSLVVRVRGVPPRAPARSSARLLPANTGELRLFVPSLAPAATETYSISYDVPRSRKPAERVQRPAPRKHWSWKRLFSWLPF